MLISSLHYKTDFYSNIEVKFYILYFLLVMSKLFCYLFIGFMLGLLLQSNIMNNSILLFSGIIHGSYQPIHQEK